MGVCIGRCAAGNHTNVCRAAFFLSLCKTWFEPGVSAGTLRCNRFALYRCIAHSRSDPQSDPRHTRCLKSSDVSPFVTGRPYHEEVFEVSDEHGPTTAKKRRRAGNASEDDDGC